MDCLNNLVSIREFCDAGATGPFLSDFVEVSTTMLAQLANEEDLTGKAYGDRLIASAIEQVKADVQLSAMDGYAVKDTVYTYSNACTFTNNHSNWGVILNNFHRSAYSTMFIPTIRFKANFTGEFNLVLHDGKVATVFIAEAVAGQEVSIEVAYSTKMPNVKIYAEDATKTFALLQCPTTTCSSCSANKQGIYIQSQGWNRVTPSNQPCGFIPTAYLACSADEVLCNGVNRNRPLFAKAIALKAGALAYTRLLLSTRMNDTTLNIDLDAARTYLNTLEGKYRELMFGSAQAYGNASTNGIIYVIRQGLKSGNDTCIACNAQVYTSTATF